MGLTARQLEVRKTGLGASEIAELMGFSDFGGPREVYDRKTGGGQEFIGNRWTYWGNKHEANIAH
jgi:predicted phage-related endonuclease